MTGLSLIELMVAVVLGLLVVLAAIGLFTSAIPLLLFAWALGETILPHHWGILIGLALASQVVGQGLMIYAIGHLSPLVVGIALLSQPVVAGAVGWFAYDERLGVPDFIGAALVAAALVLVRLAPDGGRIRSGGEGAV